MNTYSFQHIDQMRDQACVDDLLDLAVPASGDVGQGPGRFLLDVGLVMVQQQGEHGQDPSIQRYLSLLICTSHNVTNGTQCGCLTEEEHTQGLFHNPRVRC